MSQRDIQGLIRAHEILSDYFEDLAAEHDSTWPWQIFKRRYLIIQTRSLQELGRRLVVEAKEKQLDNSRAHA